MLDISRCCFLNQPSLTEVCFLLTVFLGLFSIQTVFSQPIPPYVGQCIFFRTDLTDYRISLLVGFYLLVLFLSIDFSYWLLAADCELASLPVNLAYAMLFSWIG